MATDSIKLYALIYVALLALAASKWVFFNIPFFGYWEAFTATMLSAVAKTVLIVGYYQHLRWENRSLTGLMLLSLALVMLLMVAASYSIT